MDSISIKARAKINLAISVIGKRADGYHELDMLMQSLSLSDIITITKVNKPGYGVKLSSTAVGLPTDAKNLAYRAADYMIKEYSLPCGLFIHISKKIPISAGLGGGSADCAAVLNGVNELFSLSVTPEKLAEIGFRFGSDVPFCVMNGFCRAEGVGERLTKLEPLGRVKVLLIRPQVSVPTPEIFTSYDNIDPPAQPDILSVIEAIKSNGVKAASVLFKNSLEAVTIKKHPIIANIKEFMLRRGAFVSLMSGSGASVFGLFDDGTSVVSAANSARAAFPRADVINTSFQ
ncbi:4-diphosphocytidyl-2-C-methyl-D-erythritol kinase [Clostridia bacterium]|nr:4-diphosphocytidyl-2-C-methyl-D-erythritol kinase [Clostridia bacterium]